MNAPEGPFEDRVVAELHRLLDAAVPDVDARSVSERAWTHHRRSHRASWGTPVAATAVAVLVLALVIDFQLLGPKTSPGSSSPTAVQDSIASPRTVPTTTTRPQLSEQERSDLYWSLVIAYIPAPSARRFRTLDDIVEGSDVIVRGRVVGRQIVDPSGSTSGGGVGEPGDAKVFGLVKVDEVLKGDQRLRGTSIAVTPLARPEVTDAELPGGEVIIFLKNYALYAAASGTPPPSDSPLWSRYFLANRYQAVLRELDGVVNVLPAPEGWWDAFGPFPQTVDRVPFQEVVDRIIDLVGT